MADVTALFFDLDLAVRTRIHKGVRYRWLPRKPGDGLRLSQITRVLDQRQSEEVVVSRGHDGIWVKRFDTGPNAGTRFVGRFTAISDETTLVSLEAHLGGRGFAQGLGRLSPIGLEKALARTLSDYQRLVAKYVPGRARGRVVDALIDLGKGVAEVRRLPAPQHCRVVTTLLEAAWAVAAADDPPDDAERDAMQALAGALWQTVMEDAVERRMVREAVAANAHHGVEARCTALGERLRSLGVASLGMSIAVLMAEVSRGLDVPELSALRCMAAAAGIDQAELGRLVRQMDEILSGGDRLSRMSMFCVP